MKRVVAAIALFSALTGCATFHNRNTFLDGMPPNAPVMDVAMTVENYRFTPSVIHVEAGTRLRLGITSLGSKHEIWIKEFEIHQTIPAGRTVTVDVYLAEPGEYRYGCSLGVGIHYLFGMKGRIIVE
ncbi:MAG: cupredoxin domain-containing protein [bacterium]|nr:MAG: cupredoxin domain-containing protein [bacterium]